MKTSYSIEQLKAMAREVFELNPGADKVFATRMGQLFLPHAVNAAQMHARDEGGEKPLKIYTITRDEAYDDISSKDDAASGDGSVVHPDETPGSVDDDPDALAREAITKAIDLQIIKKSGNFYSFGEQKLGQGIKQVVSFLNENADVCQAILEKSAKLNA